MPLVELLVDRRHVRLTDGCRLDGHLDLVDLAVVAQIHLQDVAHLRCLDTFGGQQLLALGAHLVVGGTDGLGVGDCQGGLVGADEVVPVVGGEHAECAEDTGVAGDHDPADPDVAGDRAHVDRPGAPGSEESEPPWVVAALHRHLTDGGRHLGVDDVVDAGGRFEIRRPESVGDLGAHGLAGQLAVEGHAPAQEVIGRDVAEHHVGVGHRGEVASPLVAGRSRVRSGAGGAHLQQPGLVDAGDAATARTHGVDVEHGQHEPVTGHRALACH